MLQNKQTLLIIFTIFEIKFILNEFISEFKENDPFVLLASELPYENSTLVNKLLPYVGNGHLASTVFGDSVYLNGLYNGYAESSHRARLPNIHNFFIHLNSSTFLNKQYCLHLKHGTFIEQLENEKVTIQRRVFAHQYYNRLLITQIVVHRKKGFKGDILIKLNFTSDLTSQDFDFDNPIKIKDYRLLKGKTKSVEYPQFQNDKLNVFMYYTPLKDIVLKSSDNYAIQTFMSSIDLSREPALAEFEIALSYIFIGKSQRLYARHVRSFLRIWRNSRIELDNFELQSNIYSSYYYLYSSLPAQSHYGSLNQFYNLSPGTLSRGTVDDDYQGHSFWDAETWMLPSILMFNPKLAKAMLSYRIFLGNASEYNAKLFNTSGWRFPWESARTGLDVSPDLGCKQYELHINGDIAFAARQYLSATRDMTWLKKEKGGELIIKLAEFWESRITYNQEKKRYEINNVLPPDEDATPFVKNSAYTNIVAALSIYFSNYTKCLMKKEPLSSESIEKARCLHVPIDSNRNIHLEYEGYVNAQIKQADVVLIGFPLMWKMNDSIRRNDLVFYENLTRSTGPAMTWSMHTISHIELGNLEKAAQELKKSYSLNIRKPFNVWTELTRDIGAVNFITGAGGFLQVFIFGYGGLRLDVEELRFNGDSPLPPNSTYLYLHGIKYLGSSFSLNNTADYIHIKFEHIGEHYDLELVTTRRIYELFAGFERILPKVKFDYIIRSKAKTNCALPYDKIDLLTC